MSSKYNLTLIRTRRCYTPKEIAFLYTVNRKTISRWLQEGLQPIMPDTKPLLIRGSELRRFLSEQKQKRSRPLRSEDEFYCLPCKQRVTAKEGSIEVVSTGKRIGRENRMQERKTGTCPICTKQLSRYL